jgi:membrane peptidoglycan carboxypeptidase
MSRLVRPARREGGLVHQVVVIIGISILSGALMAGLALPWVGLLSKGAENSADAVKSFPKKLDFKPLNERTRVLAADGTPLATFYDENRKYVTLDKISDVMQKAIIAIEDARFYQHGALDVRGTLRALFINQANDETVQGGSSITQQLVKLTLQENATTAEQRQAASAKSYARKFDELRYAVWVEDHLSKHQILEHYLNTAYFGDGAYGIEAAAHHYFSTTAAKLTLPQAALLAGIVKNPSDYDPTNNRDEARDRRDTVIGKMLDLHIITTHHAKKATKAPLGLHTTTFKNGCVNTRAPFFCSYLLNYLLDDPALGKTTEQRRHAIYGGGLTIQSTIDPRFQRAADQSVHSHVYKSDRAIGALAEVEPGTGYVRALSQSRPMGPNRKAGQTFLNFTVPTEYGDAPGFRAGSTFKLFVLAAAIKQGIPLNKTIYAPPAYPDYLGDYKTCTGFYPDHSTFTFHNSTESGNKDMYSGTQESVNTFFVQLEKMTGLCEPWELARSMGVRLNANRGEPNPDRVPSSTLGVSDVSPLEMAEAYATAANRGVHCDSTPVLEIRDRNGDVIPTPGPQCNRVLKPAYADAINDILRGVMEPGGFGENIALDQPSAGKTGTVQPSTSVWFVGYTPTLAAAAMIAGVKPNGDPMSIDYTTIGGVNVGSAHGSTTAGPMWGDAMRAIEQWLPDDNFVSPDPTVVNGQTVSIPSFFGASPQDAAKQLSKLGFNPQIVSYTVNSSAPEGTVAYTSPSYEGTSGETVSIYISNGYTPPEHTKPPDNPGPGGGGGGGGGNDPGPGGGGGGGNNPPGHDH